MAWKKIIILLGIIATIHAIVVFGLLPKRKAAAKPVPAPAAPTLPAQKTAGQMPASLPKPPPPLPPAPRPERTSEKVVPWDYRGAKSLPPALAKRAKRSRSGIIVDLENRKVLWSKNARRPVAVASLTKLMTALLVARKMHQDPDFKWTTPVTISNAATSVERSCVLGLKKKDLYAVGELMQSMMINSHNDSAAQLAELVSGNVNAFVAEMNRTGRQMGLTSVNFNSPNGLPQGKKRINSFASAADIIHICEKLIDYPRIMTLCTMRSAQLHTGRRVYSHNNLLLGPTRRRPKRRPVPGIIGFKTGFTNAAGCCLAFGVKRNGKTVIGCVTGFPSAAERDIFCREIIEWAYRKKN